MGKDEELLPGKRVPHKFGTGEATYKITIDAPQKGVEAYYFGLLGLLEDRDPFGHSIAEEGRIEKIKDIYTAGETSAYFGMVEQRKGAQQDKFQQIMGNVGQMVKTLFQLIRELRIMDERLEYYTKSMDRDAKDARAAEVGLKGIWVDMVEGGAKNPGSVIGLASQVGFVTLPDLFFSIHPKNKASIQSDVEKLKEGGFNRKVREVLERKLFQYMTWKEKTYEELTKGKKFKLGYLRQHYNVIKIYLNWLKPYLRNIKRLQTKDATDDKDILSAFDTSKIELEVLGIKEKGFKHYKPCVRIQINFVTIPQLSFQQEGYQRGAIHTGKAQITIEGFTTTEEDLQKYKKEQEEEDFELLKAVDESIEALREDLDKYLIEAGQITKEEPKEEKKETILAPFGHLIDGFREAVGFPKKSKEEKLQKKTEKQQKDERGKAQGSAMNIAYLTYKIFKIQNGMFTE